jgi:hypothetical protein
MTRGMIHMNIRRFLTVAVLAAATTSCGDVVRAGRSPMILVVDQLTGGRGGPTPGQQAANLISDVLTNVTSPDPCTSTSPCPTIFGDTGAATLRLVPKDISVAPTTNNEVTVSRYHVAYRRSDGRNTQGLDVPYAFDGASTATVPASGTATVGIELVRTQAKAEPPLAQLANSAVTIGIIADVTFYGRDRVGNDINATGSISIAFGNFGDQ